MGPERRQLSCKAHGQHTPLLSAACQPNRSHTFRGSCSETPAAEATDPVAAEAQEQRRGARPRDRLPSASGISPRAPKAAVCCHLS